MSVFSQQQSATGGGLRGRRLAITAAGLVLFGMLAACTGPANSGPADSGAVETGPGTEDVVLKITTDSFMQPMLEAAAELFQEEYPNVSFEFTGETFDNIVANAARVASGPNPPDLLRLASMGDLVKNNLLLNLDPYAEAYGWDSWPQSQFESVKVEEDGVTRGGGSLYGVGPGFGYTGVYYNIELAEQLGMTAPPTSLDELEQLLADAKDAGIQPMVMGSTDGETQYTLQNLIINYGGKQPIQDWNFGVPGATFNTEASVQAATTMVEWFEKGYLPADLNSLDGTAAGARLAEGNTLFYPSGNWWAPTLDASMPGNVGFFLWPGISESEPRAAATAFQLFAVPAGAKNARAAVAFLDFLQTNEGARQAALDLLGAVPGGPVDAAPPASDPDTAVGQTVLAFQELLAEDGAVEFIANATLSISVSTLTPQIQLLIAGDTTPAAFAERVQADYESSLGE